MSMNVAVVLVLSLATVVVLLVGFLSTTRRSRTPVPAPTLLGAPVGGPGVVGADYDDPRTIKVGDTISCHGLRSRVLGATYFSCQGQSWTEFLLDDGTRRYPRLSVEVRQGPPPAAAPHLEVLTWTEVPTQGMIPAKSMISMTGVEFFPIERGTASFQSEGRSGFPERGLVDFADYRAVDGRLLSFERLQGRSWTASYAQPLPPGSIIFISRAA